MAKNLNTKKETNAAEESAAKKVVLVGTYKGDMLKTWPKWYCYPVRATDKISEAEAAKINTLWLFKGAAEQKNYKAEFVGVKTRAELVRDYGYPAEGKAHGEKYLLFKKTALYRIKDTPPEEAERVFVRMADFSRSPKVRKQLKAYFESPDRADPDLAKLLPSIVTKVPRENLRVCEAAVQLSFWDLPGMKETVKKEMDARFEKQQSNICPQLAAYCQSATQSLRSGSEEERDKPIRVVELFAGVGGFRIGLERASRRYETVWNNQWEPATKRQDASIVYQSCFGEVGHSNQDVATVSVEQIPQADLLVGGFPCQDYSVATTLKNSGGIEGKKGVLWWQIHRILRDSTNPPSYLMLENVDRLLKSPATQRGRDFAIILASLADLGYVVEWRVVNAADYGMPQRRRRTFIVAYRNTTKLAKLAMNAKDNPSAWLFEKGILAKAFEASPKEGTNLVQCEIQGELPEVTKCFNLSSPNESPFKESGVMIARHVWTQSVEPIYNGVRVTLGDLLVDERNVPEEFFISDASLKEWKYLKGSKSEKRVSPEGFEYNYTEGGMAFPDVLDKPSRTIITGEGGSSPSRFKHVVQTPSGRFRRLMPLELERLNMFPDNHTANASDGKRAFLMGNALVTGIVERIGLVLKEFI